MEEATVRALPRVKYGNREYFVDERLREFRSVSHPPEAIEFVPDATDVSPWLLDDATDSGKRETTNPRLLDRGRCKGSSRRTPARSGAEPGPPARRRHNPLRDRLLRSWPGVRPGPRIAGENRSRHIFGWLDCREAVLLE